MDLIQAFILGMIVMLAICIVPGVTEEIRKNGLKPGKRVYCKDCKYCQQCPDGSGLCRATAPMPPQEEPGFTAWPRVEADDWCGEGVRKEQ